MALITVIVPNYNHAPFLERRLNSILGQSFTDFEVIVLDDASTDESRQVLEQYCTDPRIKEVIVNEVNSGSPFRQWKKGLDKAAGEWVWIAESDDWCEIGFLAALAPAMKRQDCVLAYAEITWVDEAGNVLKTTERDPERWYSPRQFIRQKMLMQDWLVNAGMVVFRKSAALQVHPAWLEMRQAGDYWFWCEIARQGMVYACGKPLCYFRRHPQTVSSSLLYTSLHYDESMAVLDRMRETGMLHASDIRRYIRQQLVQLETTRKGMAPEQYETDFGYWRNTAAQRRMRVPYSEVCTYAYCRKAAHFLKSRLSTPVW